METGLVYYSRFSMTPGPSTRPFFLPVTLNHVPSIVACLLKKKIFLNLSLSRNKI